MSCDQFYPILIRATVEKLQFSIFLYPILDSEKIVKEIMVTVDDISERSISDKDIDHLAFHDILTGLPNRLFLVERLNNVISKAVENNTKVAVIFFDLDPH